MAETKKAEHLPCGHTLEQAAWLGCKKDMCRPRDEQISTEYWAQKRVSQSDDE